MRRTVISTVVSGLLCLTGAASGAIRAAGTTAAGTTAAGTTAAGTTAAGTPGDREAGARIEPISTTHTSMAVSAPRQVGAECPQIPQAGAASRAALARVPAATAIARIPVLSVLARAITRAGLTARLDSARPVTVFAPDNAAFAGLGSGNVTTLMSRKHDLAQVLRYLVVSGRVSPGDFAAGRIFSTLARHPLVVFLHGTAYKVDTAKVLCGDIRTSDGTIYILDKVLVPVLSRRALRAWAAPQPTGA